MVASFSAENGPLFVLFCCNLSDFGLILIEAVNSHQADKDVFKEKIIRSTAWELLNP